MNTVTKHYPLILLGILGGSILIYLFTISLLNQPIADDVAYFRYFETGSAISFMDWHYFEHTGRFLQSLLISVGYLIVGSASVKIMPFILYLFLVAVMAWALYKFVPWKKDTLIFSVVTSLAISGSAILLMPSTYDSYLWWTSSSIYLSSISIVIFTICAAYSLAQGTVSKAVVSLFLFVMFIGQTLSEITSVILIGSCGLVLIYYLLKKNVDKIKLFLKVFIALVAGFLVTYLSPGSVTRRTSEDGNQIGFDFIRVFILSTKHTFELMASLALWEASLAIAIGLLISLTIKRLNKETIKNSFFVIIGVMVIGIYGVFCVNNFVWYNMPYRALTLPGFVLTLSLIAVSALCFNFFLNRYALTSLAKTLVLIIVLILLVPSIFGAVRFSNSTIAFMSARDTAYPAREESIAKQLQSGSKNIEVEALPILLKSQATDLDYGADEQVIWYKAAIKAHNNIPAETVIYVVAPPGGYCTFGIQESEACTKRGDNTVFRNAIKKINDFMVYYFSLDY